MRSLLVLSAVGLIACASEPTSIEFAEFAAPPSFDTLWTQVEQCSGLIRSPVTRYGIAYTRTVDGFFVGEVWAGGAYVLNDDRILLAPFAVMAWIPDSSRNEVIRHEMLHAHLMPLGVMGHPNEYFAAKCGALVGH